MGKKRNKILKRFLFQQNNKILQKIKILKKIRNINTIGLN